MIEEMKEDIEKFGDKNCGSILLKSCEIIGDPIFCND